MRCTARPVTKIVQPHLIGQFIGNLTDGTRRHGRDMEQEAKVVTWDRTMGGTLDVLQRLYGTW